MPQDYPPFHEHLLAKFYKYATGNNEQQKLRLLERSLSAMLNYNARNQYRKTIWRLVLIKTKMKCLIYYCS